MSYLLYNQHLLASRTAKNNATPIPSSLSSKLGCSSKEFNPIVDRVHNHRDNSIVKEKCGAVYPKTTVGYSRAPAVLLTQVHDMPTNRTSPTVV